MNVVHLMGNLTADVDVRYTDAGKIIGRFTVATRRDMKNAEGKYDSDFINCIAFGKTAENIGNYFAKGNRIMVHGRIQTGSYTDKNGQKKYTTDVVVSNFEFVDKRGSNGGSSTNGGSFGSMGGQVSEQELANMSF